MVEKDSMIYRHLGDSGLKVSAISYGNWLTGHQAGFQQDQFQCFKASVDGGVNFLDTAEIYGLGQAETILGNTLIRGDWNRDDLVISTKFIKAGMSLSKTGLGRKRLIQGMRNSLKRLQLDYVDIMFLHRPDQEVPIEQTVRAVNHLIQKGKADYWATSEYSPQQLMEIYKTCDKFGFIRPIAEQCQYNMMWRENMEVKLVPFFDNFGLGTTIWSPLFGGVLTGKYNDLNVPEGSRVADPSLPPHVKARYEQIFQPENREKYLRIFEGLHQISQELECSQAQLVLAWTVKNNDVSTAIMGGTKVHQVENNLGSIAVLEKLTPEIEARIEDLLQNRPDAGMNWRTWAPLPPRR